MQQRANLTDRAKRYRAVKNVTGPRKCVLCGSRSDIQVMHLSGSEDDGERANLAYGCRSCNGKLSAAFKSIGAGKRTAQYNPASGVPTFEQYAWAVSQQQHSGAHGEHGAIIHATPKHKRIEYARRIARKASATKREKFEDRWNPGKASYRGRGSAELERMHAAVAVHLYDNDFLDRGRARDELAKIDHALELARKREAKSNPWPFSRADARRTTPATGGIAYHTARRGKVSAKDGPAGSHKGYRLSRTPDGEYFSSLDPASWFETKAQAKAHIDRFLKGRGNPTFSGRKMTQAERDEAYRYEDEQQALAEKHAEWVREQQKKALKRGNPSKFDKCVRDVKKKGGAANAYAVCTAAGTRKKNPAAGAAKVFKEFHGFEPSETITVTKKVHYHEHLSAAGKLTQLDVWGIDDAGHKITGFKGAMLAFNEEKNQLFIEGGDQSVNLKDFGITAPHEMETLGEITDIGYHTRKDHLGDEGGEAIYVHKFRSTNQDGRHVIVKIARYPDLIYKTRDEALFFSGGSYEILAEGINK